MKFVNKLINEYLQSTCLHFHKINVNILIYNRGYQSLIKDLDLLNEAPEAVSALRT